MIEISTTFVYVCIQKSTHRDFRGPNIFCWRVLIVCFLKEIEPRAGLVHEAVVWPSQNAALFTGLRAPAPSLHELSGSGLCCCEPRTLLAKHARRVIVRALLARINVGQ